MENKTLLVLLPILALIVGGVIGYIVAPNSITNECEICEVCDNTNEDLVCDECPVCEPIETIVYKYSKDTPNEELIKNSGLTEEEQKHTTVQTFYIDCDSWKEREIDEGRLVDNCWKEKRNIVTLEPRRNGNQCAVVSTTGC